MKTGFTPIKLPDYVELHLCANPGEVRAEPVHQWESTAYRASTCCQYGRRYGLLARHRSGWLASPVSLGRSTRTTTTRSMLPTKELPTEPRDHAAPRCIGHTRWRVSPVGWLHADT